ncbi:MAG: DUF2851 family protein [Parachlamydiaceae bacterium]|nr:DUF2851 family protein [Parachlamydiaceae bacterium]
MENPYRRLIENPIDAVAEKKHAYHFLTERHIQALWMEQKYVKNLTSSEGEAIEVISPGIWNIEAGPDFRKAHIRVGQRESYGDVEIHLNDDSWYHHHHHNDERYNQVVLHVSLWKPRQPIPIVSSANKSILTLHLESFLTIPLARIVQLIDLELYPYKKFIGSGKCAQELFKGLPDTRIGVFFQKAADWRLEQKSQYMNVRVAEPLLQAGAGIAMALGYKNNAERFLELFLEIDKENFIDEESALAWLMSKCGFFKDHFARIWGKSDLYQHLKLQADKFENASSVQLSLNQIRPLNHPVRRLVYLAKMHFDNSIKAILLHLTALWKQNWREYNRVGKWKPLLESFLFLIPNYKDDYWNSHFLFENEKRTETLTLIGDDLKREIVINTFLPLLQGELDNCDYLELEAFKGFYNSLPASKTGKAKYLAHRFFGNTPKGKILNKADIEQGAYQLHHDFCVHFEASCEGCPFVQRFKTSFH